MNKQQMRGLGKGLGALLSTIEAQPTEFVTIIAIKEIIPNKFQPRTNFEEESLNDLCSSIKQYGILQPIIVRKTLNGYQLVAGERRWRASQQAGLSEIPAVVRDYTDAEMTEIALIENLQRQNLNAIEEALAYQCLMHEFGLTQDELSQKVGRSRSHIANFIRLLNLPLQIQEFVSRGTLNMGQARPIVAIEDPEVQFTAAEIIIDEDLSARDAEALVKKLMAGQSAKRLDKSPKEYQEIFVVEAEDRLKLALGTQVKIRPGKKKSKIEIEFYSHEDLDRIIETFTSRQMKNQHNEQEKFIV